MTELQHTDDCPDSDDRMIYRRAWADGLVSVHCRTCKANRASHRTRPRKADPPPRYRCPAHLDEPVTWRGNGCRHCASERRELAEQRHDRRAQAAARRHTGKRTPAAPLIESL